MNLDTLIDAIGMVDDRFFEPEIQNRATGVVGKRVTALLVAAAVFLLSIGTAMALSEDFRQIVFSLFHIHTQEKPPVSDAADASPQYSGIAGMGTVNIDGKVNAYYFTSDGYVMTCDGGFYTSEQIQSGAAPAQPTFWKIAPEGIAEVKSSRVDMSLTCGDRTLRIVFDHAQINGKLCIRVWPQELDENPVGNGWNAQPIPGRTDVVLLTVPVHTGKDYTHRFLLLELDTLQTTDLLAGVDLHDVLMDAGWFTEDLSYAIIMCSDIESFVSGYWLCDLRSGTATPCDQIVDSDAKIISCYFLNNESVLFTQRADDETLTIVRFHIPTGEKHTVISGVRSRNAEGIGYINVQTGSGSSRHGMLYHEDGSVELIDLLTDQRIMMTGVEASRMTASENPDGSSIFVAYKGAPVDEWGGHCLTDIGILNTKTGELMMLSRDIGSAAEYFWGWIDNSTVAITSRDANGYYVYVYEFE